MLMIVVTRCPSCQKRRDVEVVKNDYYAWKRGRYAQDAFPYLSASERESLITGICDDCWGKATSLRNCPF